MGIIALMHCQFFLKIFVLHRARKSIAFQADFEGHQHRIVRRHRREASGGGDDLERDLQRQDQDAQGRQRDQQQAHLGRVDLLGIAAQIALRRAQADEVEEDGRM